MDFKEEIARLRKAGKSSEEIAEAFTSAINECESAEEVRAVREALEKYYADNDYMLKTLAEIDDVQMKEFLDGFGNLMMTLDSLTFPLKNR